MYIARSKIYNYTKEELQHMLDTNSTFTQILKEIGLRGGSSMITLKKVIDEYSLDMTQYRINNYNYKKNIAKNAFSSSYDLESKLKKNSNSSSHKLKIKLIDYGLKESRCELCNSTEWLGRPIKLHLHHIDGDHTNNELDNLQLLCPNCHSFTDNYGVYNSSKYKENIKIKYTKQSKEKQNQKRHVCPICGGHKDKRSSQCVSCSNLSRKSSPPVSKEELNELISCLPFTKIGEKFGVSDNAVRKWCKKYGLPFRKKDIESHCT